MGIGDWRNLVGGECLGGVAGVGIGYEMSTRFRLFK